jgi:ATP-dependent helicase HrpB
VSANLPVDAALPALKRALADGTRAVLEAPPGAGKTTRVPPALLDEAWLGGRRILMLEPRRIAARAAASFMASHYGETVGETVGYRVRFEARVGPRTRIEVVTEGILARMLQDDPALEGVGLVIFDEFHERHLASDLGLALALDAQQVLRPDLRILVMSATLDGARLAAWLAGERIVSEGRSFPVAVRWRPGTGDEPLSRSVLRGVREALADGEGDVLVFLPGRREIEQAAQVLASHIDGLAHAQHPARTDTVRPEEDAEHPSRRANPIGMRFETAPSAPPDRERGSQDPARDDTVRPEEDAEHPSRRANPIGMRFETAPSAPPDRERGSQDPARDDTVRPEEDAEHPSRRANPIGMRFETAPSAPPDRERAAGAANRSGALRVAMLHGEMDLAEQAALLLPPRPGERRVILATNVAESSLTLAGVRAVVDSGLAREPRFDPSSGFTRLETVRISGPSATQRAGRAGRLGPGLCIRLWPESQRLDPAPRAEIQQAELSGLALEMAAWGSAELRFPDPPPAGALAQARDLLGALAALDGDHRITPLGRRILALGAQPRLGAMLAAAESERGGSGSSRDRRAAAGAADASAALACDLAALLEARDPMRGAARFSDDLRLRWQALAALRARRPLPDASPAALAAIDQAARGWRRRLGAGDPPSDVHSHALGDLLIHAFPDRIARADPERPLAFQLANGRRARLADDSALRGEPWLVVAELKPEPGEARILRAAPFDPALLESHWPQRFTRARSTRFNPAGRALECHDEIRFGRLLLERRAVPVEAGPRSAAALLEGVRALGLEALPWGEATRSLRARVALLREHCPELGLPDLSEAVLLATLEDWLTPWLQSLTRLDALAASDLHEALRGRLDHAQRQVLEREAPTRIRVPSGMERAVDYGEQGPVLAVKLQELFGLAETPAIARGRVPLTLHLLSPAGRPLQVTRDLRSFWQNTYPEVRREMKGRYPKHPWPEDPWSAQPTHRAKPRRD